jgi:hypothetical protein
MVGLSACTQVLSTIPRNRICVTEESKLRVQVVDDEIIVTRPGSLYSVTYYKPERSQQLIAKRIADRDDRRVTLSEFLAEAWRLANENARELGLARGTTN